MLYLTNLDLNKNELLNAVIHNLATPPSDPKTGQIYFDTSTDVNKLKIWNGSEWVTIGADVKTNVAKSDTNGNIVVDGQEMQVYRLPAATAEILGGVKIGNGITIAEDGTISVDVSAHQTFDITATSEQTDVIAIQAATAGATLHAGDTAIVKREIGEGTNKHQYTAYVYDTSNPEDKKWIAMDGNYNANNVFLDSDITLAGNYTQVGNLTKSQTGTATFATKGKSVADAFTEIFSKKLQPNTPTLPSVTLTFAKAGAYEVGSVVSPAYSASLSAGSYQYGPATGITAESWEITDTDGNTGNTATGTFPDVTVTDSTNYKITAKANYPQGAIAKDNLGGDSNPIVRIKAGSATKTSSSITGYRNTFYGTTNDKAALTNETIRSLTKSNKALSNGSTFTISIPQNAQRVVFAYPATLEDVASVKDVNGLNAEIASAFTKSEMTITGAGDDAGIAYKVYVTEYAEPAEKANTYTVKI